MPKKDENVSDNFGPYKDEKSRLKAQDIKGNHKDMVNKCSDTRSRARIRRTFSDGLLGSKSLLSLKEVRFYEKKFPAGILISNIKYNYLRSQNDNLFYLFHNQLDYSLTHYFPESESIKGNVDKFLSDPLMTLHTKKLSYQNTDIWIEKLSEILQGISNNKWIKYKFEFQSGVTRMARREIVIYLQNMMRYLKILIKYLGFWHNQIFEPSYVYNENKEQIYNEIHIGK